MPVDMASVVLAANSVIRMTWEVRKLEMMAAYGDETPVSGDAIAQDLRNLPRSAKLLSTTTD